MSLARSNRAELLPGVLFSLAAFMLALPAAQSLRADTILLKNGNRIVAESITESGDKIYYDSDNGRVSIPKNMVDRVEKDGAAPEPNSSSVLEPERDPASLPPAIRLTLDLKQLQRVVKDGVVDDRALAELSSKAAESDVDRKNAVNAYLLAAVTEAKNGRMNEADRWAGGALDIGGNDRNALLIASEISLTMRNYSQALQHMLVAQGIDPDSPDVLTLLGDAYYFAEGPERALRFWKQAEQMRPDPKLEERIQRAAREADVESGFQRASSYHFQLSWEGSTLSNAFGQQVLESLEQSYRELETTLDYSSREPITVILYGSQQFGDITRSPRWAGAVNDGKIRVPVQGLTSVNGELARILKHELTHSFIYQIAGGRCPVWLNEGLAQMQAGESPLLDQNGAVLARAYRNSQQIPLQLLEGSFGKFNSSEALLAYAESLAAVQMIRDQYGDYYLPDLLKALSKGQPTSAVLKSVMRVDYAEFESEVGAYLNRRYGK